ncbi:YolD-like family protein [Anaerofustis stercorihominis]|uniref:YolD-like family protein n=1 Tax=Anaerofustis TaxID=264995 RepID=UPI001FA9BDCF|nr:YolD-like family protein [Anaerofustis stercorihominis]MCO8193487.1 YolD-like family protein [Anaerofustis sp. NSJ-163]
MESQNRIKMKREDRAKQFMPFKALKGYDEALRIKEKVKVEKKEFSREYEEVLDYKLRQLKRNDIVKIIYYFKGEYIEKTGKVSKIDTVSRCLYITNDRILFDNIYDIDIIKEK